jgi:uncharacterized protein
MTLYEAVEAADAEAVVARLEAGEDINQMGPGGATPLIEAARMGNAQLVEVLLAAGAEPMLKDAEQDSALLKAAANGHRDVCALLFPTASEDERGMAEAFLGAVGKTHGPSVAPPPEGFLGIRKKTEELKRRAAVLGARAARFVGYEKPADRIEQLERAEERTGTVTDRPRLDPKK